MQKQIHLIATVILTFFIACQINAQSDARINPLFQLANTATTPLNHLTTDIPLTAIVINDGNTQLTNIQLSFSLLKSGEVILEDSLIRDTLNSGVAVVLDFDTAYTVTENGTYEVIYEVKHDSIDDTPENNTASPVALVVGDSVYSRSTGAVEGSLGLPTGIAGELGSSFYIPIPDTLTSVTAYIANSRGGMTNQELSVNVRSYANKTPGAIIASSDTITYTESGGSFVDFRFKNYGNYVDLEADSFMVTIVQRNQNITLGVTSSMFFGGINWAFFNNSWTALDNQFQGAFMLNLNFGIPNTSTSINESESIFSQLNIYPNPSNGIFTLSVHNEDLSKAITLQLIDGIGKLIKEESFFGERLVQKKLDLSELENGVYLIRLKQADKTITKRIIIQ